MTPEQEAKLKRLEEITDQEEQQHRDEMEREHLEESPEIRPKPTEEQFNALIKIIMESGK